MTERLQNALEAQVTGGAPSAPTGHHVGDPGELDRPADPLGDELFQERLHRRRNVVEPPADGRLAKVAVEAVHGDA
jgi:hypothetical protein